MRQYSLKTIFDGEAITVHRYRCTGSACHGHREEVAFAHEIVIPTEGVFLRRDSSGEVFGDVTQAVLFTDGEPYKIDHPSDQPDACFILSPAEALLSQARGDHPGLAEDDDDFRFRSAGLPLAHQDWWFLADTLAYFTRHAMDEPLGAEEAVVTLIDRIGAKADEISDRGGRTPPANANERRNKLASDVRVYLNDNFQDQVRLDDISAALDSSTFHMCRSFRAATGRTINQYLTALRLRKALDLLADAETSITAIAYDLGFSSHSHFTSRFHDSFGRTPSEARAQLYA